MSESKDKNIIWFDKPIKGFIGAKKEVINGQTIWVKVAPTKNAKGFRKSTMKTRG